VISLPQEFLFTFAPIAFFAFIDFFAISIDADTADFHYRRYRDAAFADIFSMHYISRFQCRRRFLHFIFFMPLHADISHDAEPPLPIASSSFSRDFIAAAAAISFRWRRLPAIFRRYARHWAAAISLSHTPLRFFMPERRRFS